MFFKKIPFLYVNIDKETFNNKDDFCIQKIHPCFNGLDSQIKDKVITIINEAIIIIRDNCKEDLFTKTKKFALIHVTIDRKMFKNSKDGSCMIYKHPCVDNLETNLREKVQTLLFEAIDTIRNNIEFKDL